MSVLDFETNVARILIVEDEALLALDLAQSLRDFGYEVVGTAARADDAIRKTLECKPDLILMDINLPGDMDGIEAYSKIREEMDVPVVYLTGYTESDVLQRAKETEPYGYLGKPVSLVELRITLETAFYKHKADKRVRESEFRYECFFESWPVPLWEENWSSVLEHLRLVSEKGLCSAKEAVEADPGLVAECASRVRFGKINKSALRLFGASSREDFPHDLNPLLSDESLLDFKNQLLAVVEGKRIFEAETKRNLLGGGEIVVLLSMAAPFDGPTGDVPLILSVTDITCRKRTEQELRESRDQLELIVENRTAELKRVNEELGSQLTESKRVGKVLLERDALIRSISDNLPSGMIYQVVRNNDGSRKFTYLSERVRDFYGCKAAEAMNDPSLIYGRVHPEDQARVFAEEEKAHETLSDFRTEVRMIDPSGKERWSYYASSPTRLDDGTTCWSGLEIDITERKESEEALRESEQRFRELYKNLRDGVAEVDEEGHFVRCNSRFLNMLGYSFEELSTLTYEDVTPGRWHAMELQIGQEQIDVRGYSDLYEKEYIHKNGTIFPVEIQTYLAKDRDGKKTGYWAFARDISDRKRDEEELRIEKKFTDNALNSQRDTFFLFDPSNGRAIRWNRAFNDITGYTDEEIATMSAPDSYYSPPDLKRAGIFIQEVLRKGIGQIELELVCKDGHKVPYEYICSPVKDVYGKVKY